MGTDKRDANGKLHDGNNGWFKSEGASSPTKEEANKMDSSELRQSLVQYLDEKDAITIKLPDIQLPRSIGAKWRNEEVMDLATGNKYKFVEGSKLQDVEVFCGHGTKSIYQDAYKYADKFGGFPDEWQHAKAVAELETDEGVQKAEVHWSQHPKYGKREFFIKRWID